MQILSQMKALLHPSKPPTERVISPSEATRIIAARGLRPGCDAAHYSWDIERFYDRMSIIERHGLTYVYSLRPINEWAPAPLFTDDPNIAALPAMPGKDCPFWFLWLKGLDDYLARRSAGSSNPRYSFPSLETYPRVRRQIGCELERYSLEANEELFVRWYDALKDPKYAHSGEACLAGARGQAQRAPAAWFAFYALREAASGDCKCVTLVIEDGRSCSGINIAAARRNNGGYGVLLAVEMIKSLSDRGYVSFDSGVSQRYGTYKDVIFLDVLATDCTGQPAFAIG